MGEIENEFHFVLMCPVVLDFDKNEKKIHYERPSFLKFVQLFSTYNFKCTHKYYILY